MNEKAKAEMEYQLDWVRYFSTNKESVLEYWCKYRYFNTILEICKPNKESKILDVGCGISTILHFLPGERYGIDSLANKYKKLYKYPEDLNIIKTDCEKLPFADNFFDIIFCSNAFDHFDNIEKANSEIYRVLKKNGYFVLAVEFYQEYRDRGAAHPHCLTKSEVYNYIKDYTCLYQREVPWIGLREYIKNITESNDKELLLILQK